MPTSANLGREEQAEDCSKVYRVRLLVHRILRSNHDCPHLAWSNEGRSCRCIPQVCLCNGDSRLSRDAGKQGCLGVTKIEGDVCHFTTLTFWESREAIKAFAGENIEIARYYPEDEKYLLEFEPTVTHYELFE